VTKMTEKKKTEVAQKSDAETKGDPSLPAFVKAAPELLPLWDWWVKEGKTVMVTVLVIALGAAGFIGIRGYRQGRHAKATEALVKSNTQEELSTAVAEYGSSGAGTGLKLCLAKNYYDAGQYQDALSLYEAVLNGDKDDPFRDIAELGRAHSLEGLKKYADASEAFSKYASDEAKAHDGFRLTAQLGVARCKALQGDVAGAEADLKALKEATTDNMKQRRIEEMLTLLKHYDFSRVDPNPEDALTLSLDDSEPTPAPEAKSAPAVPAKPAVKPAVPAKPTVTVSPAKPVAKPAPPAKPAVAPAKPAATAPAKPVSPVPAKPAVTAPAKPAATAPAKPAAPAPAKPAATAPAKPAPKK